MLIRKERTEDHSAVYELITEAFLTAERADGDEQDVVVKLRKGDSFIPELSLVAELNGMIVGHILFTKARVGDTAVLVLAPLSVKPAVQRQGIGLSLMDAGHETAKKLGYPYVFVLGSERYYPKAGYIPAQRLGVTVPDGINSENFMAMRLLPDAPQLSGKLIYAPEFGISY